jgi:hypothetical protein
MVRGGDAAASAAGAAGCCERAYDPVTIASSAPVSLVVNGASISVPGPTV